MTEIPYMMTNTRAEFERVRDLAWPVTDRTAATDAEFRSRIAPFESAPTPPEVREAAVIAAVTEALLITVLGTDDRDFLTGCGELPVDEIARLIVEYGAAAAVAAYRAAQDGGAEEAVRRVLSLAESIRRGEVGPLDQELVAFLIRVAVTDSVALAEALR